MTEKELRKLMEKNRLAASPYVLINRMYSRNVLNKVTDADEPTWKISDFYSRYSYYAQFEYYEFGLSAERAHRGAPTTGRQRFISRSTCRQVKAKVAGEASNVHNQTYLTLEEFDKIIDRASRQHPSCALQLQEPEVFPRPQAQCVRQHERRAEQRGRPRHGRAHQP